MKKKINISKLRHIFVAAAILNIDSSIMNKCNSVDLISIGTLGFCFFFYFFLRKFDILNTSWK